MRRLTQLRAWSVMLTPQPQACFASKAKDNCSLLQAYLGDVRRGWLEADDQQQHCIEELDILLNRLQEQHHVVDAYNSKLRHYLDRRKVAVKALNDKEEERIKARADNWLLSRIDAWFPPEKQSRAALQAERDRALEKMLGDAPEKPECPKGLYIHGSVGTGKTMLMDRFYGAAETIPGLLHRRMHFNTALLEVHSRMHAYEQEAKKQLRAGSKDSKEEVAVLERQAKRAKLAIRRFLRQRTKQTDEALSLSLVQDNAQIFSSVGEELMGVNKSRGKSKSDREFEGVQMHAGVLCFDEININDPFTALALKGIFESLIESGISIVATSNRAPWDLNLQGVHEAIFAHFKAKLTQSCKAISIDCADFRRKSGDGKELGDNYSYHSSKSSFEKAWEEALHAEGFLQPETVVIPVLFNRTLHVGESAGGIARFSFSELCDNPRGASDYHAISKHFHTVFLKDIPIMSFQMRNMARRFITLLDELYNSQCRLVCTAQGKPEELFASSVQGDSALFHAEQLEQLQFESAAEGTRLRRDVMSEGGVAPVFGQGTATVTTAFLGGLEEAFAFARAVSRMYEMSRMKPKEKVLQSKQGLQERTFGAHKMRIS